MKRSLALKFILGVVMAASLLFATWTTMAARSATVTSTVGTSMIPPASTGTGRVTVTANNASCLSSTVPNGNGPFNWEVVQGGSYTVTITNVTECTGDTITVFLQSTPTGNRCFQATGTAGSGTYAFSITMPDNACETYPISYKCGANQPCNNQNTFDARGPNGEDTVHLRAAIFDDNCQKTGNDTDCTGTPQGCVLQAPPDSDLGCNPPTIPDCDTSSVIVTGTIQGGVPAGITCEKIDSQQGCTHTRKLTYSATGIDGVPCTATQTITWTVDTESPTFNNCTSGTTDLGCNPSTIPGADSAVTASDNCGSATVTSQVEDTGSDCGRVRTITYTAEDGCHNKSTCVKTYLWKIDTTNPTFDNCTGSNTDLGCNPASIPGADSKITASDNCGSATVTSKVVDSGTDCSGRTRTITYTAEDSCHNKSTCVQIYTWKVDTTPPIITTPGNITANGTGACCTNVSYQAGADDSCTGVVSFSCNPPSGTCFPVGTTTVVCNATDGCGNPAQSSFNVTVKGQICATKFYDADASGVQNAGEGVIAGWKITLSDGQSGYTAANGSVCFNVIPGTYTVTEVLPSGSWNASTPISQQVTISSTNCSQSVTFGNYCKIPSGGLTLGFWSNRNGQAILLANDPAWRTLLNGCCLRNADGTTFTISTADTFSKAYAAFRTWILNANATNMAYMLSAQLAAMKLNIMFGNVKGNVNAFDLCSHMTIGDLVLAANDALCADDSTPSGDPNRALQEALKNCLDALNNNGKVVNPTPCQFTTPY